MGMVCTVDLDMQATCEPVTIDKLVANVCWLILSAYHTMFGSLPSAAISDMDVLFASHT